MEESDVAKKEMEIRETVMVNETVREKETDDVRETGGDEKHKTDSVGEIRDKQEIDTVKEMDATEGSDVTEKETENRKVQEIDVLKETVCVQEIDGAKETAGNEKRGTDSVAGSIDEQETDIVKETGHADVHKKQDTDSVVESRDKQETDAMKETCHGDVDKKQETDSVVGTHDKRETDSTKETGDDNVKERDEIDSVVSGSPNKLETCTTNEVKALSEIGLKNETGEIDLMNDETDALKMASSATKGAESESERDACWTLGVLSSLSQDSYQPPTVGQSEGATDGALSEKDVFMAGMSGRFPGAENLKELRQQLQQGKPGESKEKPNRWPEALFDTAFPYRCLDHPSHFDADFWAMTEEQVFNSTPLLWHLLEVIYEVILDSGLTLDDVQSSQMKTGIYLAVSSDIDGFLISRRCLTPYTSTSSQMAVVIGGMLQTKGPSLCVDSGANSSLVAIHTAVSDLQRGIVHYAIVAGGNLLLNPHAAMAMEQEKLKAHRNFIQSDGVAAILLARNKKLCPRIYATLKDTSLTCYTPQDGNNQDKLEMDEMCQTEIDKGKTIVHISDLDAENSRHPELCSHCGPAEGLAMIIRAILEIQIACSSPHKSRFHGEDGRFWTDCLLHIQTHGLGGEKGEILLQPYFSCNDSTNGSLSQLEADKLVLLPLGLNQLVCDALTESQCSASMVGLLSRSLLVRDSFYHPVQASVLLSVGKGIVSRMVERASSPRDDQSLMVFFGDVFTDNLAKDTLVLTIPAFAASIRQSFKVLAELQHEDKEFEDIMETSNYSFILLGLFIQIALADTLKACIHGNMTVMGVGLGTLTSAYIDGCLTCRQCVQVACCIMKLVQAWAVNHGNDYTTLMVRMPHDQVYTLGPKVQVLAIYTDTLSIITVRTTKPSGANGSSPTVEDSDVVCLDHITDMIKGKGGSYQLIPSTPFYNHHHKASFCSELLPRIRSIIPHPIMWSQEFWPACVILSDSLQCVEDAMLTAENLVHCLFNPVDQPAVIRSSLLEPDFILLAHFPCCDDLDLEGFDLQGGSDIQGDLVSCRLLELKAEATDILAVLGKLHAMAFKVNTLESGEAVSQVPADCTVLPLSPLVTWDHSKEWPLPTWTEFFCKDKDEIVNQFECTVQQKEGDLDSFTGDILYFTCVAFMSYLENETQALRLSNMVLHCNLSSLWGISHLCFHACMGRRIFQIYHEDILIVSGNFNKAEEDLGMPEESVVKEPAQPPSQSQLVTNQVPDQSTQQTMQRGEGTGCLWFGSKSLDLFRILIITLQEELVGKVLLQKHQLFPLEMTFHWQRHLAAIGRSWVDVDVETYTGVCNSAGFTFKFLPCLQTTPSSLNEDTSSCFTVHLDPGLVTGAADPQEIWASQYNNNNNNNMADMEAGTTKRWIWRIIKDMEEVESNSSNDVEQRRVITLEDSMKETLKDKVKDIAQPQKPESRSLDKGGSMRDNMLQKEAILQKQSHPLQTNTDITDSVHSGTGIASKQKEHLWNGKMQEGLESIPENFDDGGSPASDIHQTEVNSKEQLQNKSPVDSLQVVTGVTSEQKEEKKQEKNTSEDSGAHHWPEYLADKDAEEEEGENVNINAVEKGNSEEDTLSDSHVTSSSSGWLTGTDDGLSLLDSAPNSASVSNEHRRCGSCQLDTAVMKELSLGMSLQITDTVEVVLAEVINICSDIVVLLYLGTDCINTCKVAGIWSPEYDDITLQVPVPDTWKIPHALMLLYSLTAAYVVEEARGSIQARRPIFIHPPFDALSLSVMMSLQNSGEGFEVIALTDDHSAPFIQSLCPHVGCCQPRSMLSSSGSKVATHFSWADRDVSSFACRLAPSSHVIQCSQPTWLFLERSANMTLTFVEPQRAVRETLAYMKRGDASGDRILRHLADYLPGAIQSQQILLLDTPASLGLGFERLETHRFRGKMTLNSLAYAMLSPSGYLPSLLPDTFEDDLDFLAVMDDLLFTPPEILGQTAGMQQSRGPVLPDFASVTTQDSILTQVSGSVQTEEGPNFFQAEDGIDGKSTTSNTSSLSGQVEAYEPLRITLLSNAEREVELVDEKSMQTLSASNTAEQVMSQLREDENQRKQTREKSVQTEGKLTQKTDQQTQTAKLESHDEEVDHYLSAQGDESVIMLDSFSHPLASGTPHGLADSINNFKSAASDHHSMDKVIVCDSNCDYTDRHPSDSAARCSPWGSGVLQDKGDSADFIGYDSPTSHPKLSDASFATPNSLNRKQAGSNTFTSATPISPSIKQRSISETVTLPIAPLTGSQSWEDTSHSFLSCSSPTVTHNQQDLPNTSDSEEARILSLQPLAPSLGSTYWDIYPSDSEKQERRYFDTDRNQDSSTSEEDTDSLYKQDKADKKVQQQEKLESVPKTEKVVPVSKFHALSKGYLGLDVSNPSMSTKGSKAEESSELSPIPTQSEQQKATLARPQQQEMMPISARSPAAEQTWKQACLIPPMLLNRPPRNDTTCVRYLEPAHEKGTQLLSPIAIEKTSYKIYKLTGKQNMEVSCHKSQDLQGDTTARPTSYFVPAPSKATEKFRAGIAMGQVKRRHSPKLEHQVGRDGLEKAQAANIGWCVDRKHQVLSLNGDAVTGGKLKTSRAGADDVSVKDEAMKKRISVMIMLPKIETLRGLVNPEEKESVEGDLSLNTSHSDEPSDSSDSSVEILDTHNESYTSSNAENTNGAGEIEHTSTTAENGAGEIEHTSTTAENAECAAGASYIGGNESNAESMKNTNTEGNACGHSDKLPEKKELQLAEKWDELLKYFGATGLFKSPHASRNTAHMAKTKTEENRCSSSDDSPAVIQHQSLSEVSEYHAIKDVTDLCTSGYTHNTELETQGNVYHRYDSPARTNQHRFAENLDQSGMYAGASFQTEAPHSSGNTEKTGPVISPGIQYHLLAESLCEVDQYFTAKEHSNVSYMSGKTDNTDAVEKTKTGPSSHGLRESSPALRQQHLSAESLARADKYGIAAKSGLSSIKNVSSHMEPLKPLPKPWLGNTEQMESTKTHGNVCHKYDRPARTNQDLLAETLDELDAYVAATTGADAPQTSCRINYADPVRSPWINHHLLAESLGEVDQYLADKELEDATFGRSAVKEIKTGHKSRCLHEISPPVSQGHLSAESLKEVDRLLAESDLCDKEGDKGLVQDVNPGKRLVSSFSQGAQPHVVRHKTDNRRMGPPMIQSLPDKHSSDHKKNAALSTHAQETSWALVYAEEVKECKEEFEFVEASLPSITDVSSHTEPLKPIPKPRLDKGMTASKKEASRKTEHRAKGGHGHKKHGKGTRGSPDSHDYIVKTVLELAELTAGNMDKYASLVESVPPNELLPCMPGDVLSPELAAEIEDSMNTEVKAKDLSNEDQKSDMATAAGNQARNESHEEGIGTKDSGEDTTEKQTTEHRGENNKGKEKTKDETESTRDSEGTEKGGGKDREQERSGDGHGDRRRDSGDDNGESTGKTGSDESEDNIDPAMVRSYIDLVIRMAQLQYMSLTESPRHQHSPQENEECVFLECEKLRRAPEEDNKNEFAAACFHGENNSTSEHPTVERSEDLTVDTLGDQSGVDTDKNSLEGSCRFDTPEKPRFSFSLEQSSLFDLSLSSMDSSMIMDTKQRGSVCGEPHLMTLPGISQAESGRTHTEPQEIMDTWPEISPESDDDQSLLKTPPIVTMEMLSKSPIIDTIVLQDTSLQGDDNELKEMSSQVKATTAAVVPVDSAVPPSPLPQPLDTAPYSCNSMSTPVRNSGHDIPLVMPKTPVPCIRRRHTVAGTCSHAAAEAARFGARACLLKSYSLNESDSTTKAGQSRPPLLRSVTSLTSPVKDILGAKLKMSPLFEVPRRKSGSPLTMTPQCSVVRKLSLFSRKQGLNQHDSKDKSLTSGEKSLNPTDGIGLNETYSLEESLSTDENSLNQTISTGLNHTYDVEESLSSGENSLNQSDMHRSDELTPDGFSKSPSPSSSIQQDKSNQSADSTFTRSIDFIPSCAKKDGGALAPPPSPDKKGQDHFKIKRVPLSKISKRKATEDYSCMRSVRKSLDLSSKPRMRCTIISSNETDGHFEEIPQEDIGDQTQREYSAFNREHAKTEHAEQEHPQVKLTGKEQFEIESVEKELPEMKHIERDHTEIDHTEVKDAETDLSEIKHTESHNEMKESDRDQGNMKKIERNHAEMKDIERDYTEIINTETHQAEMKNTDRNHAEMKDTERDFVKMKDTERDYMKMKDTESGHAVMKYTDIDHTEMKETDRDHAEMNHSDLDHTVMTGADGFHSERKENKTDHTEMKPAERDNAEIKCIEIKHTRRGHAGRESTIMTHAEKDHTYSSSREIHPKHITLEPEAETTRHQTRKLSTLFPEWNPEVGFQDKKLGSQPPVRRVSMVKMAGQKLSAYSPGIQGLLEPSDIKGVLEPLAPIKGKSALIPPLYIVHPITGSVEMLKELAQGLDGVCMGVQKTESAVDFSIESLARFYCQAITQRDRRGVYRLAGYSYGGMVVFEMARQLQREGKRVELLLFLDGSPTYVHCQTQYPQRQLPLDASPQRAAALVETHVLLHIIGMYKSLEQRALVAVMLQELDTQEERVEAAIGVTMGTVQISSSMARGRWLSLKAKVEEAKQGQRKVSISKVAEDIISLKRQEKAKQMLHAAAIADQYDPSDGEGFQGGGPQ